MRLSSPIVLALAHSATRQPPSTRARTIAAARQDKILIDFSDADVVASWQPVDDRIMGGASTSRCVALEDGSMSFDGQLVVEGGGFASARYFQPLQLPSDLEAFELEIASDGRMGYKLTLSSAAAEQGVSYQHVLPQLDRPGQFQSVRLQLRDFKPTFRGRPAPSAPPLRASDVRGCGLMLSRYEVAGGVKESIPAGGFQLKLRRLATAESELAINGRRWL